MVQAGWVYKGVHVCLETDTECQCVSKWLGESRVLTVVGENHGASKLGLQCNAHVYASVCVSKW